MEAVESIQELASIQKQTGRVNSGASVPADKRVLVHVESLRKEYAVGHTKVHALQDVTLDIFEGEFVAITGSSGSGKSTLLQLMGGLDRPSSGKIAIDGVDLSHMSDHKLSTFRGQTIGFVFQFFYLQPFLNTRRNIEVPGMFTRMNHKLRRQRAIELAGDVGLAERTSHLPKELSGGQIQRAAIARALLNNPKLLLADEPTGNLDSSNGEKIISLFEEIRKTYGTTIIIVTHDYKIAGRADRQIALKDGYVI